ncbi:MAG: hypothetical protein B7X08_00010 [Acidocella sp. 20-63-7]|nr:MAG: hypothetical protein B7X08_00010 [Acidocella sp. 20-63-7]HQT46042.1 protoglobin domain-containing protein [Acidocella sp.]
MRETRINGVLSSLNRSSPEIDASALVSKDGRILASALSPGVDAQRIGIAVASILPIAERLALDLNRGGMERIVISGEQGHVLIIRVSSEAILCVIASKATMLGLLFVDTGRVATTLLSMENVSAEDDADDANMDPLCQTSGFNRADRAILRKVQGHISPFLPELTDRFYSVIVQEPQIAPYLEGRIDQLKITHLSWLKGLFVGDYGGEFIRRQEEIGKAHVRAQIPPIFIAASMAFLRQVFPSLLTANIPTPEDAAAATASLLRLLSLCQNLIDHKYSQILLRLEQRQKQGAN